MTPINVFRGEISSHFVRDLTLKVAARTTGSSLSRSELLLPDDKRHGVPRRRYHAANWTRELCISSNPQTGFGAARINDSPPVAMTGSDPRPRPPVREEVSRFLRRNEDRRKVVRAVGVEPTRAVRPCGFSYRLRLSPPGAVRSHAARFAVWTIPSPSPDAPELRCCPSSLYTFPAEFSVQAWLGIAISGFPEFEQFCIAGFPASTQVFLKSAAYAIPPRPRGCYIALPMIEHAREFTRPFASVGRGSIGTLGGFLRLFLAA